MNLIDKDELNTRLNEVKNLIKIQTASKPIVNLKQIELLQARVEEIDNRIKTLKPIDDKIYINQEFVEELKMESKLVLDEIKPHPSGEILNKIFKTKTTGTKPTKTVENNV